MNKRKFQRKKSKTALVMPAVPTTAREMNDKAAEFVRYAENGEARLEYLGHFIFLSTERGQAWLLDYRRSGALRLAEGGVKTNYLIRESTKEFSILWQEKFSFAGESFVVTGKNGTEAIDDCPVRDLQLVIGLLQKSADKKRDKATAL
jgi:hypothetical protein